MTFSLSSSDLKVPIAFVTCCYHTPSSIKERAHPHLSCSVSSVKDGIVFPSFHIFARVDREKSIRILNVWTRIKKRRESLVRCRRGLNINYGSICIWFILRILTTDYQHIQKYFEQNRIKRNGTGNKNCVFSLSFRTMGNSLRSRW